MDFKRQPFLEKSISEINPEKDIGIAILGRVIDINSKNIVIDDSSGSASAYFANEDALKNLSMNDIVRLFGFIMPNPEGFEIKGDFIQKMNGIDVSLYRKVMLKKLTE